VDAAFGRQIASGAFECLILHVSQSSQFRRIWEGDENWPVRVLPD